MLLSLFLACTDAETTAPAAPPPRPPAPPPAEPLPEETPPVAAPQPAHAPDVDAGSVAWSTHSCLACHGERGEGGVGPQLAGAVPDIETMTTRIRAGAAPMPAFSEEALPDTMIHDIHAWLLQQPRPGPPAPSPHTISTHSGVDVELVVSGLDHPISLAWGAGDALYVSTNGGLFPRAGQKVGKIWRIDSGRAVLFATDIERPLGMVWHDDALIVSSRGRLSSWADRDGDGRAEEIGVLIDDLPAAGLHQNNGVVLGPDGMLYLGIGTATNADPEALPAGSILQVDPVTGAAVVHAAGLRNPFDLAFTADGELYATDNGVDPKLVEAAPEELNHIEAGSFYGHPYVFGDTIRSDLTMPDDLIAVPPLARLTPHASANGLLAYNGEAFPELHGKLLIAEFGSYITRFRRAGRQLTTVDPVDGSVDIWASGFAGRPLDVLAGPSGDIYVTDFEQGTVWRFFPSDRKRMTFSPSFDCQKATTAVEHAICNDPQLAALDGELDAAYQEARSILNNDEKRVLRDAQRAWLKVRDACEADTWPVLCVKTTVMERLEELRNEPGM